MYVEGSLRGGGVAAIKGHVEGHGFLRFLFFQKIKLYSYPLQHYKFSTFFAVHSLISLSIQFVFSSDFLS